MSVLVSCIPLEVEGAHDGWLREQRADQLTDPTIMIMIIFISDGANHDVDNHVVAGGLIGQ